MKVAYRKRFLKDLASVPSHLRSSIERFVFEELPRADSLQSTGKIEEAEGV
jgi:mRNA interferase RelE/StbE